MGLITFLWTIPMIIHIWVVIGTEAIGQEVPKSISHTGRWEYGQILDCNYIFSRSRREKYRHDQADTLLIWLGPPSEAIRVEGKHGTVPLPSAWGSFANVLYTECPKDHSPIGYKLFQDFLIQWMEAHPQMKQRPFYLSGNVAMTQGGEFVVHLAHSLIFDTTTSSSLVPQLHGIFFHATSPVLLPNAQFFADKSFESGNGMNFWTINRAKQSVVCNAKLSAVEFYSYDIKLRYELKESHEMNKKEEMFEYDLVHITDWEKCHEDINYFTEYFSEKDAILAKELEQNSGGSIYQQSKGCSPALGCENTINPPFPSCSSPNINSTFKSGNDNHTNSGKTTVISNNFNNNNNNNILPSTELSSTFPTSLLEKINDLLAHNISIFLYHDLPHASEIICSFYIGIFIADALQYPTQNNDSFPAWKKAITKYNKATMEFLHSSWGASIDSEKSPGVLQHTENFLSTMETLPKTSIHSENEIINHRVEVVEPQLMTLYLRSTNRLVRNDPSLQAHQRAKKHIVISKIGAVSVFAKLLHAIGNNDIDLMELMVLDRMDEQTSLTEET